MQNQNNQQNQAQQRPNPPPQQQVATVKIDPNCPNCGANLEYSPEKLGLYCEHCLGVVDIPQVPAGRFPIRELQENTAPKWDEARTIECENCRAKEVIPSHAKSVSCAFCGSSNVVACEDIVGLKPNSVVPFKISKQNAIDAVTKWAKKKTFAPGRFKKNVTPTDIDGVYNPAFKFDATTTTRYNGVLSRVETTTTFVRGQAVTTSRTVRFNISGTHNGNFNNILIQACDTIKQAELNKIQPFNTNNVNAYNDAYLYGYVSGQAKRDGMACWGQARNQIEQSIQKAVLAQHPGCSIVSFNAQTNYNTASYRYVLIPVYVGHFTHKNKLYNFYINGDTGRITGKTPVSGAKVAALVGGLVVAATGIGALILWLLGHIG